MPGIEHSWTVVDEDDLIIPSETSGLVWDGPIGDCERPIALGWVGRRKGRADETGYLALDSERVAGIISQLLRAARDAGWDVRKLMDEVKGHLAAMAKLAEHERRDASNN